MRSVLLFRYRYGISLSSRPTPSPRLSSLCLLDLIPRPRGVGLVGCCRFADAGVVAVCLLASLPCRSLAIARSLLRFGSSCWACCLTVPSSFLCRHRVRASPPRSIYLKRFNWCGFLSHHPSVACVDVMPFNPPPPVSFSLLVCSVIFLICLFIACERMARCRPGSAFRSPYRLAVCPRFPFPPFRPSARRTGRVVVCAVSLMKRRGCRR